MGKAPSSSKGGLIDAWSSRSLSFNFKYVPEEAELVRER